MSEAPSAKGIDALVERLRQIHTGAEPETKPRPKHPPARARRARKQGPTVDTTSDDDPIPQLVERLAEIDQGRKLRGRLRKRKAQTPSSSSGAPDYDEVRSLFRERELSLRRQELLVDRILDGLRAGDDVRDTGEPAPLQQSLRLACAVRGSGSGRFVVENGTPSKAHVHFDVQALRGAPTGFAQSARVELEPKTLRLRPGQSRVVSVRVDLGGVPLRAGDRLDLPVSIQADTGTLGRLWIELSVVDVDARDIEEADDAAPRG